MSPREVELALKKQRLQMRSAELRDTFAGYAATWAPVFAVGDKVQAGWIWLRRHPALPVATLVAVLVARPRSVFRWVKRGYIAWQALRKLNGLARVKLPGRV